ncbi:MULTISPECIES: hypothetical protein [Bacillus]|uniref:hypothetical protein n=1 Tax=Bacillus TaxID=1386 RepID=UPI000BFC1DB9|nr:hypothetical protein [Bacillus cereus]PGY08254.1 hypothetical protein COE23_27050 [Bacillus cereus]
MEDFLVCDLNQYDIFQIDFVLSGGTVKTVKTIGKVVGTVEDIEKKAKNLDKAAKTTNFTKYPTGFDEVGPTRPKKENCTLRKYFTYKTRFSCI